MYLQQRLLIDTVYEAVEAAGQRLDQVRRTKTAVLFGFMGGDFYDVTMQDLDRVSTSMSTVTARSRLSKSTASGALGDGP